MRLARGVLAAGVLLVAVLAWRLARGPIPLAFLTPRLETALAEAGMPATRIASTALAWDTAVWRLELRATGVELGGAEGGPAATVRTLALGLGSTALLRGRIAVTAIDVVGPRLRLVYTPEGLQVQLGGAGEPGSGPALHRALLGALRPGGAAYALRRVGVRDAQVALVDAATGRVAAGARLQLALWRARGLVAGRGQLELGAGGTVRATGTHAFDTRRTAVDLVVEHVVPAELVAKVPAETPLITAAAQLALPLTGRVRLVLDGALRPTGIRLRLRGGRGTLTLPEAWGGRFGVQEAAVDAGGDLPAGLVEVRRLWLDLGVAVPRLRGRAQGLGTPAGTFEVDARVPGMAADSLWVAWPPALAPAARQWARTGLSGGRVEDLRVRASGAVAGPGRVLRVDTLAGSLGVHDVAARFLDPMPPATLLTGVGTFSRRGARFELSRGAWAGVELQQALVRIEAPERGMPRVAVETAFRGALDVLLRVLDHEPLRLAAKLGMAPDDVHGSIEGRIALAARGRERPELSGSAKLIGVGVRHAVGSWSLAGGDLDLKLDRSTAALDGEVRVEGVPMTIALRHALTDPGTRRFDIRGRVDRAGRAALGLDPGPALDGPVEVRAVVTPIGDGADAADLQLDLREAALAVPLLALEKPAGLSGTAGARLVVRHGDLAAVEQLRVDAGDARLRGEATRTADGHRWETIDLDVREGEVTLAVRTDGDRQRITLTSRDAGRIVGALGSSEARGGRLRLVGTADLEDGRIPAEADLEVRELTFTRAPVLARILGLASLPGLLTTLTRQGIAFDRITARLTHRFPTLTVTDAIARGPTLTLGLDGSVDRAQGTVDVRGTLVPALLAAPERLPLLGEVVGAAVPEVTFDVRGPLADPAVRVEPLGSLTPRTLQRLFGAPRRRGD